VSLAGRASYPEPDPTPTPSGAQPLLTPADGRLTRLPDAVRWLRALASESGTTTRRASAQGSVTGFTPAGMGRISGGVFLAMITDISEGVFMTPLGPGFQISSQPAEEGQFKFAGEERGTRRDRTTRLAAPAGPCAANGPRRGVATSTRQQVSAAAARLKECVFFPAPAPQAAHPGSTRGVEVRGSR